MKYLLVIIASAMCGLTVYAQDGVDSAQIKPNPIVYSELILGLTGGSLSGPTIGITLNYQEMKMLYTFRFIDQTDSDIEGAVVGFVGFPFITIDKRLSEYSLLVGRRNITDGKSFSYSGGISFNSVDYNKTRLSEVANSDDFFIGFPFELNIKWFKKEKKRFRAYYGIIPIGKPTSFGRSFGFKLYGNIGKLSYVGLGINYGFGWHKTY